MMDDRERLKLLFGPYHTPRVAIGRVLSCEARFLPFPPSHVTQPRL